MNIVQRYKQAPNTVKEAKLNIFAPYEKQKSQKLDGKIFESDKYIVELNGYKLNQIHRDIIDIASYYGDTSLEAQISDTRPLRTFSLYDIQKHLNYKSKNQNKWIDDKFKEISRSKITITDKQEGDWIEFNIIDVAMFRKKINAYVMVISELYVIFFENEISVNYKHYLSDILSLNAQSRALARYILSHSNSFSIGLDKAMERIGISTDNITAKSFRENRKRILDDREQLIKLNIILRENEDYSTRNQSYTIDYKMLPQIQIYHPKKQENKA